MNHSHRVLPTVGFGWIVVLGAVLGVGAQLALTSRAGAAAPDPATYVGERFKKLVEGSPADQQKAREELITGVRADTATGYADSYAQEVASQTLALLKNNKDAVRARLNAAIVVAKLSDATGSVKLVDAVGALLDEDSGESLNLWGVKASRGLLPGLVKERTSAEAGESGTEGGYEASDPAAG